MHSSRLCLVLSPLLALLWQPTWAKTPAPATATAVSTGSCNTIPLAGRDAGAVRESSAAQAWGGARTGNEASLSDRVVRYAIDAELDPVKHTLTGKQQLTWRNRSNQPVCSIYLHMYLNGFDGPGSTFMTEQRASAGGFRSNVATHDGEYGYIRLDKVVQGGAAAETR